MLKSWKESGTEFLNKKIQKKLPIILTINDILSKELKATIREFGLKFNSLRKEWYGSVEQPHFLIEKLNKSNIDFKIEYLDEN